MSVIVHKKIGNDLLDIELKSMKDYHRFNAVYGNLPDKCSLCGSENIFLSYKNPANNEYFTLSCECGAEANFGQKKEDRSLFWKGDEMKKWESAGAGQPPDNSQPPDASAGYAQPVDHSQPPNNNMPPAPEDDLPF